MIPDAAQLAQLLVLLEEAQREVDSALTETQLVEMENRRKRGGLQRARQKLIELEQKLRGKDGAA